MAALAATPTPMVIAEARLPDCPIVFANRAFLDLSGYGHDEVVGRDCRFLQGPQTDRSAAAEIEGALRRGEPVSVELLNYRKDGSTFWNALAVSPLLDEAGAVTHFLGAQRDVTQRRAVEEALGQSRKMEALGQLTGSIAHDFNNLLQVILGYVDVVSSGLRKPDADRARLARATDSIRSAADRAAALTQHLLSFARKQKPEGRVLDLNALVAGMEDRVRRTLGEAVTVERRLGPDLWTCRIDPDQAEVALLDILVNARDAMPDGGTVTIVTENQRLDGRAPVQGAPDGRFVSLAVSDTGTGIAPEILARVTEPFFTTKGESEGLGLAMVQTFAKQAGGSARIESVPGAGTTVRLSFPVEERPRAKSRPRAGANSEVGGSEPMPGDRSSPC